MLLNNFCSCPIDVSMLACNISAFLLSMPGLFPLFNFLMAVLISSSVDGLVSISCMVSILLKSQSSGSLKMVRSYISRYPVLGTALSTLHFSSISSVIVTFSTSSRCSFHLFITSHNMLISWAAPYC